MPRVLAPSPAEAEKDPEEQGWAARQGAGEGPGWAWPCPPPQNPAGCTHWRQDPRSPNSHQHPVGSTLWSCHPWGGHPSVAGWGSHPPQHRVPQGVWDSHRHCQGTVPDASSALDWGQPLSGVHAWHCRDPGLQCGGLPLAPPTRPWPPSCAGRGEPGEGGAGRTVYVCRCQVLAGHHASRAGAQLLNPLRPPHTTPARDQARPTPPGWLLCTPVTPYSMLHTASSGQKGPGMVASLAPVGPGGQEELLSRGAPLGPCAATAAHQLRGRGHAKCGSWVF